MSFKVDLKLVAATCIFLGVFIGFYVDSSIISKPRIETLTGQVEMLQVTVDETAASLSSLQSEHETLEALYNEQLENNVPVSQYEALQEEATGMEEEIASLDGQVEVLTSTVDDLENDLEDIQEDYDDLTADHDRLQERFDEVYNPGFVAFSYEGLDINVTVTKNYFEGNTPIEGTVAIRHSNGNHFEGEVKLRITSLVTKVGSPSDFYEIFGETEYSWSGAFVMGPGSYKLSLSEVLDDQGETAIPSTVLLGNYINIFMG